MPIASVLDFAHALVAEALSAGSVAVDATAGNGHDTLFLAERVGASGHVYAFDVQAAAIAQTRARLRKEGVLRSVTLVEAGHENMAAHIPDAHHGRLGAVMFNLGYLPGSDHDDVTQPSTTIPALEVASQLLAPGGIITIVVYTGHSGGAAEAETVDAWAEALDQERFDALSYRFVNQRNDPPRLVAIEKRASYD